jgi:hypothetical protein
VSSPSTPVSSSGGSCPRFTARLVADIGRIPVETVPCRALAEDASALANATGRTVYDAMYVALTVPLNTRAITADDRLQAALKMIPAVAVTSNSFRRSSVICQRAMSQRPRSERRRFGDPSLVRLSEFSSSRRLLGYRMSPVLLDPLGECLPVWRRRQQCADCRRIGRPSRTTLASPTPPFRRWARPISLTSIST